MLAVEISHEIHRAGTEYGSTRVDTYYKHPLALAIVFKRDKVWAFPLEAWAACKIQDELALLCPVLQVG